MPLGLRDGRLQRLQGAEDDQHRRTDTDPHAGADHHRTHHHDQEVVQVSSGTPEDTPAGRPGEPTTGLQQPTAPQALARLDAITRRLRKECPWDREQDERSIVPHTVEEAYELADAAQRGDDAKLLDELGDVLFQVEFLSLLMEERFRAIGKTVHGRSIFLVFTIRTHGRVHLIRPISARYVHRQGVDSYEAENPDL